VNPDSLSVLLDPVRKAGKIALEEQGRMRFGDREHKTDGSILTRADQRVEEFLVAQLERLYPEANILTEETPRPFDPERSLTFAVDPIDGTDVFSQGMHGWSVSVGVLNRDLRPIAGILCAPGWGSLFFADIGKRAVHNEGPVSPDAQAIHTLSSSMNIMIPSRLHTEFEMKHLPGKLRSVGSTALHMCFPLIYGAVVGAIAGRGHIWDFAAAHAMLLSTGFSAEYLRKGGIEYAKLVDGSPSPDLMISGSDDAIGAIRRALLTGTGEHGPCSKPFS
jgi:myo-inositol-1(or 4)-monophosphatase